MRQRNFVLVFSTDRKVVHNQKIVKPYKIKVNDPAVNTAYTFINSLGQVDYSLDQPQTKEFNNNIKSLSYQQPYKLLREVKGRTQDKLNEIKLFKRQSRDYSSDMSNQMINLFNKLAIVQKSNYTEIYEPSRVIQ